MKILILVIYSPGENYNKMLEIQRQYLHSNNNIDTYFITLHNDIDSEYLLQDDILYIKGFENRMNITYKTIKAIKFFINDNLNNYNYIIRTNMSTFCNLNKLYDTLSSIMSTNIYTGGYILDLQWLDYRSGIKNTELFGLKYSSGTSIILSNDTAKFLIDNSNKIDYNIIDDVTIGLFLKQYKEDAYKKITDFKFNFYNKDGETHSHSSVDRSYVMNSHFIRTRYVKGIEQLDFFKLIVYTYLSEI